MCWAYSTAASTSRRSPKASISSWQYARVAGSRVSTAFLVKAGSSNRRASWWNGGSDEIGGDVPTGARSSDGRTLLMTTEREEKESVS